MTSSEDLTTPLASSISGRRCVASAAMSAVGATLPKPGLAFGAQANSKTDIGLIGCGQRGKWIADLTEI